MIKVIELFPNEGGKLAINGNVSGKIYAPLAFIF